MVCPDHVKARVERLPRRWRAVAGIHLGAIGVGGIVEVNDQWRIIQAINSEELDKA
jgi:hypothetical protein